MGQRQGAGQVDPEKCVHCLPLSLTQVHCPLEDSPRIILTNDSPGVGSARPDHCERVLKVGGGIPQVFWHMVSQEEGCEW